MKVVVTGGAGFVGANLCRQLGPLPIDVTVIDDFSTGYRSNIAGLDVTLFEGSILDSSLMSEACRDVDTIVHLAARASVPRSIADPVATNDVNVNGTLQVLQAARESNAHVIFASSSSVYGSNPILPKQEDLATFPKSPYAASKLAAESYTLAYQEVYGLDTLAFRFFNIYGRLQAAGHAYAAAVPAFSSAVLAGEPLHLYGDGLQTRDFTSIASVCQVLVSAITRRVSHSGPVNLAFGTRTSLLELIRALEDISGQAAIIDRRPPRVGDVRDSQADCTLLRALFPEAEGESLAQGLEKTIGWLVESGGRQE